VYDLSAAQKSDTAMFARFFHGMLKNGIWLAPSQLEAGFLSLLIPKKILIKRLMRVPKH